MKGLIANRSRIGSQRSRRPDRAMPVLSFSRLSFLSPLFPLKYCIVSAVIVDEQTRVAG